MAHLAKNRSGYYEVRYTDETGRSRTASTRTKNKTEAKTFLREWLTAEAEDKARAKSTLIADLAEHYRKHLEAKGAGETAFLALRPAARYFGSFTPPEIMPHHVHAYREHRGHLADGTVRRELSALVAMLNYAAKHRYISKTETPHIDLPPVPQPRDVYLTCEEEAEFYALAMGHSIGQPRLTRLTRFVALAADTAARKGAICKLTWDRVDFQQGLIDFRVPGSRQTKKRNAVVPISRRLRPLLQRAYEERIGAYVLDHPGTIRKTWETWVESTPYHERATPHVLRHTWATLAAQAGVPLWDIAGVLGDTVETVTRNYAHHSPVRLRGAVDYRDAAE